MTQSAPLPRVERITFNESPAWIKRPEETRSSGFVTLHKVLEYILPAVLHRTGAVGGMSAIRAEAGRIEVFELAGLPVPKVLELTDEHLVLSNVGEQLRGVLKRTVEPAERYALLELAMLGLRDIHKAKLCHGRPFLKDMTLNADGRVYFLDFEEDPCAKMSLQDAQARDVWLLLASCAEFCPSPLEELMTLLACYRGQGGSEIDSNLEALGKALRPYRRLIGALRVQNVSQDVTGAYWSIKALELLR